MPKTKVNGKKGRQKSIGTESNILKVITKFVADKVTKFLLKYSIKFAENVEKYRFFIKVFKVLSNFIGQRS